LKKFLGEHQPLSSKSFFRQSVNLKINICLLNLYILLAAVKDFEHLQIISAHAPHPFHLLRLASRMGADLASAPAAIKEK
jgi:hypothetical protein